ncbi:hypothetical protein A1351_10165 [Methylosinus sp. R-45379]|nr:hypothetical protein A1351_10165 [Methylosinus sp. R-45379]
MTVRLVFSPAPIIPVVMMMMVVVVVIARRAVVAPAAPTPAMMMVVMVVMVVAPPSVRIVGVAVTVVVRIAIILRRLDARLGLYGLPRLGLPQERRRIRYRLQKLRIGAG